MFLLYQDKEGNPPRAQIYLGAWGVLRYAPQPPTLPKHISALPLQTKRTQPPPIIVSLRSFGSYRYVLSILCSLRRSPLSKPRVNSPRQPARLRASRTRHSARSDLSLAWHAPRDCALPSLTLDTPRSIQKAVAYLIEDFAHLSKKIRNCSQNPQNKHLAQLLKCTLRCIS